MLHTLAQSAGNSARFVFVVISLLALLGASLLSPAAAHAAADNDGTYMFSYDDSVADSPATLTGCVTYPCPVNVTIPSEINGHPVETIGEFAFSDPSCPFFEDGAPTIEHVTMSDTIKTIDSNAFCSVQSLKVDHWSQQLEAIGADAFSWAVWNNSGTLELPASLKAIGTTAFASYAGSSDLTIPASVTWIGSHAFACAGQSTGSLVVRFLGLPPAVPGTPFGCNSSSNLGDGIARSCYYGMYSVVPGSNKSIAPFLDGDYEGCFFQLEQAPSITAPQSATVALGSKVVLSVTAISHLTIFPEAPRYQWFHQNSGTPGRWTGSPIPGATEPTLTLPAVSPDDTGTYWAQASDWSGFSLSALAEVKIGTPSSAPPATRPGGDPNGSGGDSNGSANSPASQTLKVKLPKKLKKGKTYLLPKTTVQGQKVKYRFAKSKKKNAFCAVKNVKVKVKVKKKVHGKIKIRYKKVKRLALVCKKSSKKKTFWVQATAPGNASLILFTKRWKKRKVK